MNAMKAMLHLCLAAASYFGVSSASAQTIEYANTPFTYSGSVPAEFNSSGYRCVLTQHPGYKSTIESRAEDVANYTATGNGTIHARDSRIGVLNCPPPVAVLPGQWQCPGLQFTATQFWANASYVTDFNFATGEAVCNYATRVVNVGTGKTITAITGCASRPNYSGNLSLTFPASGNTLTVAATPGTKVFVNKHVKNHGCTLQYSPANCTLCGGD